jgi:hypothetical protein
VYIGSSLCIGLRIKEHIENLNAAKKHKKKGKKLEREKRRLNAIHINFWSRRPGIRDFWLVFGQLETRDHDDNEELAFFLNILEMYAMLLFRTLPPQILWRNLPKGSTMNPHSWTGLNTASPMDQWRNGPGSPITRVPHHFSLRQPASRNVLYKDADPAKGDKLRVEVMCSSCRDPQSYWVDQYPRYEIASGKYLTWVRRWCSYCSSQKFTFIPMNTSLPWKTF